MALVIIDAALASKLNAYNQPVELCDPSGRVVGQFTPQAAPVQYGPLEPQISEEEIRRREQETGGRTLDEILKDLEKRA